MNTRMTAYLVCDLVEIALWRRNFPKVVICHSNQGSLYSSSAYRTGSERINCAKA